MFNLAELSVDEILQYLVTLKQEEPERRFIQGELCDHLINMGVKPKEIGTYLLCTEGFVRQLVKVYQTFPTEESRISYQEQTYNHYKLAAYSDRPVYWMDQAADNSWSSREMSKAIKGEEVKDELKDADRIYGTVERCIDAGGKGAVYLYDQLTGYLGGVDYAGLCASTTEAGEEKEEAEEAKL